MGICDYCTKRTDGLGHRCKYCKEIHCSEHLLPESHECVGIGNHKRWWLQNEDNLVINFPTHHPKHYKSHHPKQKNPPEKVKSVISEKLHNLGYWLNRREKLPYDFKGRLNYVITTSLIFAVSLVGLVIFYSNAIKLNQINFWIIKLGGVLILTSLFFAIKFGWRLGKEIINLFKRQRNWLKYLVVLLIVILLWQAYTNKDTVLDPIFESYNKTDFSLFAPINFGNISLGSGFWNSTNPTGNSEKGSSNSLKRDVGVIEQRILVLVNEERQRNGVRYLSSKVNLNNYARAWSDKMMSEGFFEHSDLDFSYPSTAGENIGETPIHYNVVGCGATYTNNALAECFVDGWIESPGHHENIISRSFSMTGVGVSCDLFTCRATQVFSG